jgi:hypothetical protein
MEAYFNLESSEDVCVGLLGCNDNNFSFVLLLRLRQSGDIKNKSQIWVLKL